MKKLLAFLAGAAAVGGGLWLAYRKLTEHGILVSGTFEEEEPVVLAEDEEIADIETETATEE